MNVSHSVVSVMPDVLVATVLGLGLRMELVLGMELGLGLGLRMELVLGMELGLGLGLRIKWNWDWDWDWDWCFFGVICYSLFLPFPFVALAVCCCPVSAHRSSLSRREEMMVNGSIPASLPCGFILPKREFTFRLKHSIFDSILSPWFQSKMSKENQPNTVASPAPIGQNYSNRCSLER